MRARVIVFNATFNNISVISWQSDLMVEDVTSTQKEEFLEDGKGGTIHIIYVLT
jgi:hypothetical protein